MLSVTQNEFSLIPVGEAVTLICHLENATDCIWMHNGSPHDIISGYSVRDKPHNWKEAKDCSLTIFNFHNSDGGKWQCCHKGNQELVATFYLEPSRSPLNSFVQKRKRIEIIILLKMK